MTNLSKKEITKLAYVRSRIGDEDTKVLREMVSRANKYNIRVTSTFNAGVQFVVNPGMTIRQAYELLQGEMNRLGRQWEKTMKAEVIWRERRK